MARTRSGNVNANGNRDQPPAIEQIPVVVAAAEPITMAGVQAMIQAMLDRQMEETRRLLQQNREEATIQIEQPELNEGQTEEGNYSGTVGQVNPPIVRQNNQDDEVERNGCKYKDFLTCKPSTFTGKEDPIGVMDWILEMELAFMTCSCKGKQQTTFAVRQFRGGVVRWWNTLGKTLSPNEPLQLTWAEFLVHFKRRYCSAQNLLELENQFLTLKKGSMSIDEYTNNFTEKMEFALRLVPDELTKIDKYAKGLPWEYAVPVRQAPTLEAAIWAAKSVEEMIKGRAANKTEVGEKRKFEGSAKPDERSKSSTRKFRGGGSEERWCEKCKKKHSGKCSEEVTCFKCGKHGHYANECKFNKRVCYECNEEGHFKQDCPKREGATKPNVPPKPKARAFQMILDEADDNARNQG